MGDFGKGMKYLGLAALFGGMMYGIGKLRSKGKLPLTALGLTAIVVAPKGFELARSCSRDHIVLETTRINAYSKRDSIESAIKLEEYKKHSHDTTTAHFHDVIKNMTAANRELSSTYDKLLENTQGYGKVITNSDANYERILSAIEKEHKSLEEKIAKIGSSDYIKNNSSKKDAFYEDIYTDARDDAKEALNDSRSSKSLIQKMVDWYHGIGNNPKNDVDKSADKNIDYYFIDADKDNREIKVYGVCYDGSKNYLGITSNASFSITGGPEDGTYELSNKGSRTGGLYPGFLDMADPVGISGAGDNNQYLDDIQSGAYSNKTGIRVPNDVYLKLEKLVDSRKTVIEVHD